MQRSQHPGSLVAGKWDEVRVFSHRAILDSKIECSRAMTTRIMGRSPKAPTARKTPRQQRSQQTRLDLLGGATRVLQKRGAKGLTTNHVAEQAGVSVGSLYQYYPNKAALLSDLHAEEGARLWQELAPILHDRTRSTRVRLACVLEGVFVAQVAGKEHHAALADLGIDVLASPEFAEQKAAFQHELTQILVTEHGLVPAEAGVEAAFAARVVVGLLVQLAHEPCDAVDAQRLAAQTARTLTSAWPPQPAAED